MGFATNCVSFTKNNNYIIQLKMSISQLTIFDIWM